MVDEPMTGLPTGIVTFLFTDIEGSTRLWERSPETAGPALARHDALIEALVAEHDGAVVRPRGEGDSRFAVFANAVDACTAAAAIQTAFLDETWETPAPLRIRIGLHTGIADLRMGDYYGTVVNRCAWLRGIAHGGQSVVSLATARLVRDHLPDPLDLIDLGEHRLKDLSSPEHVFQLTAPRLPGDFPPLRSLSTIPNNLPVQLTEFVGREKETAEIQALLTTRRFITLIAPGGTGKTRLAIEVAARLSGAYRHGVFFIPLAPIQSADDILQTVSEAIQFSLSTETDPTTQMLNYLRTRQMLLVVDNCEHVVHGLSLVKDILETAPEITVLATSREKLNIHGETAYVCSGFEFESWKTVEAALESGAVQLFLQSARRADPDFRLDGEDLPHVIRIVRTVQGIPLGIILAAAWVDLLSAGEIAAEIERSLDFLETEQRGLPDRHRSIRAVFDYSWRLLDEGEQEIFEKLSVFRGGFTREAAAEVTGASLRSLAGLANKSLLVSNTETRRFEVHELLRQYAEEQLDGDGDLSRTAKTAHALYYAHFVASLWEPLRHHHQVESLAVVENDIENIRTAWRDLQMQGDYRTLDNFIDPIWYVYEIRGWYHAGLSLFEETRAAFSALPKTDGLELVTARLACGKAWFLSLVGRPAEGLELAEANLDTVRRLGGPSKMMLPLQSYKINAFFLSKYEGVKEIAAETVEVAGIQNDRWLSALGNSWLGSAGLALGDFDEARRRAETALATFTELDENWGSTWPSQVLAGVARAEGDTVRAREGYQLLLDSAERIGFQRGVQYTYNHLGSTLVLLGDYEGARDHFLKSLQISADIGQVREMLGAIFEIAGVQFALGELPSALEMLAMILAHPAGQQVYLFDQVSIKEKAEILRSRIEDRLDPAGYAAAWVSGRSKSLEGFTTELLV